jgi:pyruvate,water dikinase
VHKGFMHADVALSAGVQRMVRSDKGAAGVMFTLDTESGFRDVVFITSSYGLGETVVQGAVNPDEFYVHKPMLAAGKPAVIRRSLGSKMIRMEFLGQVASAGAASSTVDVTDVDRHRFSLTDAGARTGPLRDDHRAALRPPDGHRMGQGWHRRQALHPAGASGNREVSRNGMTQQKIPPQAVQQGARRGRAIGQKIGAARCASSRAIADGQGAAGDVLVTDMTDPNWEPVMKRAAAIVTNRGGRTCHAAIIARELGIPAIVGCGDATET